LPLVGLQQRQDFSSAKRLAVQIALIFVAFQVRGNLLQQRIAGGVPMRIMRIVNLLEAAAANQS
jgi:hypothetical protein